MNLTQEHWAAIGQHITDATGEGFTAPDVRGVGGGSINDAYVIEGDASRYFVKLNSASLIDMFAAEAEGLGEIKASNTIRVPAPICYDTVGNHAFIVLEYLDLGGRGAEAELGAQLAAMHRTTKDRYGWHRDNTIGSTEQVNDWMDDWVAFYRERRLGFQLRLAARNGIGGRVVSDGERLMEELAAFFTDYRPVASLLHGDLWGGNYATTSDGQPVIFDPAVYYGDREADIAMTELFGGFGPRFMSAYHEAWPLDPGYPVRKTLYNLYHILNHFNLFGGGYGGQAASKIARLLGELR